MKTKILPRHSSDGKPAERRLCGWKIVYRIYPPFLRFLEKFGFHDFRQAYKIGKLKKDIGLTDVKKRLAEHGFREDALSWKDPEETLDLRKILWPFQYHIRVFPDKEVRAHFEFAPESHPYAHITEKKFIPRKKYFKQVLNGMLD